LKLTNLKSDTPWAVVYQNGDIYSVYATFADQQIVFYWDNRLNQQHLHPRHRQSKVLVPDTRIVELTYRGCLIEIQNLQVYFEWRPPTATRKKEVIYWGEALGDWTSDDDSDFHRNYKEVSYDGLNYNDHWNGPKYDPEYE
jgi:hypothetical protein